MVVNDPAPVSWTIAIVKAVAIVVAVELIRRALANFDENQRRGRLQISGPIHVRLVEPE